MPEPARDGKHGARRPDGQTANFPPFLIPGMFGMFGKFAKDETS
jgi:hypothetical protein